MESIARDTSTHGLASEDAERQRGDRQLEAGLAVLDDRDARRVARHRGVPLTGTVAILVRLRQLGAIGSLAETLGQLDAMGFRTTQELHALALEAAGE